MKNTKHYDIIEKRDCFYQSLGRIVPETRWYCYCGIMLPWHRAGVDRCCDYCGLEYNGSASKLVTR